MTSIILLSGILGFAFSSDAFATHNPKGKGLAEGCQNGVAKNNPHCVGLVSPCDNNPMDGIITVAELLAVPATVGQITTALAGADLNNSISIDTAAELVILKTFPPFGVC